jgi:zinc/manganese transport system substrate-binding protein
MRIIALLTLLLLSAEAKLTVTVSYPYIASLTQSIGAEHVAIEILAQGKWDPHFIVPKPSLVGKLRNADLLITNGADLEIGWLPPLLNRAANSRLSQNGNTLELSRKIKLIDIPADISRSGGDVHADGNPHFHLDPRNIPLLAEAISTFLSQKDPAHSDEYRKNLSAFKQQWNTHMKRWENKMAPLRGYEVVQYHPVFNYFLRAYGLKSVATIEPLAGIPPSSSHTIKLIGIINEAKPHSILHDVYHSTKTAEFLVDKTGIKLMVVPHDVGAVTQADDLVSLFDTLTQSFR